MKTPDQVRDLAPSEHNPRVISHKRGEQLAKSMSKFGDLSGIVFNRRSQRLVCGHQRVKHLQGNAKINKSPLKDDAGTVAVGRIVSGKASWDYREVDWDDKTEKAAMIAANAAGGDFDGDMLRGLVVDLDRSGFQMDLLNLRNLEDILKEAQDERESAEDETPPLAGGKPRSKRGDVWVLGEHRVMCGDSTSAADVRKLMGTEAADMVFTDPPYGVSYESKDFDVIEGDRKRDDELHAMVTAALKNAVRFTREDAAFYIWHASSTRRDFDDALRDAGLVERQYLIWVKNSIAMGFADYRWGHEPCYYASKDGKKPAWYGGRDQPSVWRATLKKRDAQATTLGTGVLLMDGKGGQLALLPRMPQKGKKPRGARVAEGQSLLVETASNSTTVFEVKRDTDYVRPTQKPVELATIAIRNSTQPRGIVLDLFGGSGTTMIGCEVTGRRARLMEMDPRYVDAEVKRWEEQTGRRAELERR